jgi:hypothetical protein
MEKIRTFTEKSNHPEFPNSCVVHEYLSDNGDIYVESTGIDGKRYEKEKIIKGQEVTIDIINFDRVIILGTKIKTEQGCIHLYNMEEIDWLSHMANLKITKPNPERIKEAQDDLDACQKESEDLANLLKNDGFLVKGTPRNTIHMLEVTKKDVTTRIWIDKEGKGFSYQAGYMENPFANKRVCKKRETLFRQINTIISEVLSGKILS